MPTAQAAGLALVASARAGIPVTLHTPSEVKAAVTGSGRAGKEQVTTMVTRILRLPAPPRPADAADALALAICRVWRAGAVVAQASGTQPGATKPSDAPSGATAAQRAWREAESAARRVNRWR